MGTGAPHWARTLVGVGLALAVVAVAALIGVRALTERYDSSVARGQLLDDDARRDRTDPDGPLNYLLVGSDRFRGADDADQRSDTILIVHLPAGLRQAYLVSVPRDLLVAIPPAPNGYRGGQDKINAAYDLGGGGAGGARLLSATLHRLTGLEFDGAAVVDFTGLRRVIDLLGGVRMCVDTEVRSVHTGTVFAPGCRQMDGAAALDYVRQRYDLPDGDYDRQRHQQQLLRAMLDRAGQTNLLGDPLRLDSLIRAVGDSLTVDTNGVPLEDLVLALRALPADGLVGVRVPSSPQLIGQVSYVVLDDGGNALFAAVRAARMAPWAAANPRWVNRL
ncbi:cell envelope-related function transcriptional attenuator common domain-containing protein [Micromonospora pallida]|uniref:Cell envelope-related function transcriptional attenuator common domain-containing protein n=1 Tax=Micromonospora pallida TaxID=145854 RepID=A0A1C6TB70_9ACTN|nr:LCP family protein [Micromonospora pallida]SCL39056.1 cell envelope-related function transcriptional attenuator common domain-containing protein [Micromonospora pallida]